MEQRMSKKYDIGAHVKYKIRYHIIFSTKYRKRCLTDIREQVLDSFRYVESLSNFKILAMEIDSDHIHFLITCSPTYSIGEIVRRMKQISTDQIWNTCTTHMHKYYWGRKKKLWTGGYFVSTIGDIGEDILVEYIKNQG
jgi:putative transposase